LVEEFYFFAAIANVENLESEICIHEKMSHRSVINDFNANTLAETYGGSNLKIVFGAINYEDIFVICAQ
jgi:hypothetical protein